MAASYSTKSRKNVDVNASTKNEFRGWNLILGVDETEFLKERRSN